MQYRETLEEFDFNYRRMNLSQIKKFGVDYEIRSNGLFMNVKDNEDPDKSYFVIFKWFYCIELGLSYIWGIGDEKYIDMESENFQPDRVYPAYQYRTGTVAMFTKDLGSPEEFKSSDIFDNLVKDLIRTAKNTEQ